MESVTKILDGTGWKGRKLGYTVSHIFKLGSLLELLQHKLCETTADLEITQELSPDMLWTSTAKVVLMVTNYLSMLICM